MRQTFWARLPSATILAKITFNIRLHSPVCPYCTCRLVGLNLQRHQGQRCVKDFVAI